jgi:putative membrane protein
MKTSTPQVTATLAVLALAFAPVLMAQQTSGPDQTQNARANDSTADQHAATTGAPGQGNTVNMNDSKDGTTESLDKNPSNASTDSGAQSTTKDPSDATTTGTDKNSSASSNDEKMEKLTDKEFVMRAAQGGMTEVELGKVASEKASSSQVKDFGARMVKDHSQANDELKDLAQKKGIAISPKLDTRHEAQVERLSKLSGSAFDKAYVKNQVTAHEMTVKLFREEAQTGQDPDLKAFASRTLPVLQDHCSSIMNIENNGAK